MIYKTLSRKLKVQQHASHYKSDKHGYSWRSWSTSSTRGVTVKRYEHDMERAGHQYA